MLQMIEERAAIRAAQDKLMSVLRSALSPQGRHNIGYPGGNENHTVYANGANEMYCAFAPPRHVTGVPRYWNSFGIFRPQASRQEIIAEINVPVSGDDARVAGFFARNPDTDDVYLMHDGKLGGGRQGIGKWDFLDYISDPLFKVHGSRRSRDALLIANLNDPGLPALIWRFVCKANAFKQSRGGARASRTRPDDREADGYVPEFWGRKRGTRRGEIDHFTYHGMIVDELKREREAALVDGEQVDRDRLVDLFVCVGKRRTEIYEVKTSTDRQSFYTGVGQLMTHAREASVKRILVLPDDMALPPDCSEAIHRLRIEVRRFRICGAGLNARVSLVPI